MCLIESEKLIDEVLVELVADRMPFTALNVSLLVQAKGGTERHRDMKCYIHQATSPLIGFDPTWQRMLIRPKNAPIDAWLYFPNEFDPNNFGKDKEDESNQPVASNFVPAAAVVAADGGTYGPHVSAPDIPWGCGFTLPRQAPQQASSTRAANAAACPPTPDGAVKSNAENRLCVPKRLLIDLGLKPGDTVHVIVDQGCGEIRLTSKPDPAATKGLRVDVRQTVRLSPRLLKDAGLQGMFFNIAKNNDMVTVKVH